VKLVVKISGATVPLRQGMGAGNSFCILAMTASACFISNMSGIVEIEDAIEKLPGPQVDELAVWQEALRVSPPCQHRLMVGSNVRAAQPVLMRRPEK